MPQHGQVTQEKTITFLTSAIPAVGWTQPGKVRSTQGNSILHIPKLHGPTTLMLSHESAFVYYHS